MNVEQDLGRVSRNLHSVAIHLLRTVRVQDSALGIGPSQLSALSVVVFGGPLSLHQLAKAEQVRPPTMSRIVDGLVKDKLVKREVNNEDRRSVTISPTGRGIRVMEEGRHRREKRLVELLKPLTPEDIRLVEKAAEILTGILQPGQDTRG